jgi:hypothetical protein
VIYSGCTFVRFKGLGDISGPLITTFVNQYIGIRDAEVKPEPEPYAQYIIAIAMIFILSLSIQVFSTISDTVHFQMQF